MLERDMHVLSISAFLNFRKFQLVLGYIMFVFTILGYITITGGFSFTGDITMGCKETDLIM